LEVVLLGDGIEFVVVAGGAAGGETEESGAEGLDAVAGEVDGDFLGDGATFVGGHAATHEAGGDEFVDGFGGRRSPASCSRTKRSKGLLALKARMT